MKTPKPEDLIAAADWVEACQGEDRQRLQRVAAWLRGRAAIKCADKSPSGNAGQRLFLAVQDAILLHHGDSYGQTIAAMEVIGITPCPPFRDMPHDPTGGVS